MKPTHPFQQKETDMKYIDADKLIAEIERRIESWTIRGKHSPAGQGRDTCESRVTELSDLLSFIAPLQQEQPDIDLEKALNGLDNVYFDLDGIAVKGATYYLTVNDLKDIARDFYELGLKAEKK